MSNNCQPGLRNVAAMLSFQPRTSISASLLASLLRRQTFSTKTATPRQPASLPRRKITLIAGGVAVAAAVAYDGFVNGFERIGGAHRFVRCLGIAATISADYAWNLNGLNEDEPDYARRIGAINQRSADRLLAGCLANGGLYVKIGQGVSAINHILPREYTETLKQLENECLPRAADEVRRMFAAEFGRTPEQLFAQFDYNPVAAASLAQVFRARTLDGRDVAVKVQYADLASRFAGDFGTIQLLQSAVKRVHKAYNFSWILDEVRTNLEQELDFLNEAKNGERCAVDIRQQGGRLRRYVHVPRICWDLTTRRILTTDWIEGYKCTDLKRLAADGLNVADVDRKLFDTFAEQIFGTGFVHADPHPGNVFVRRNRDGAADIVLLDHGLYEYLPLNVRRSLCQFWEALVLKDAVKMQKYATELGVDDYDKLAEILLQRPLHSSGPPSMRMTDAEIAYMQKMARERFEVTLATLRQMPKTMLFVVRNLNTIRAIARRHGDPLDRPAHMARYAQRCIYRHENAIDAGDVDDDAGKTNAVVLQKQQRVGKRFATLRWLWRRMRFEYHLFMVQLGFWWMRTSVRWLAWFAGKSTEVEFLLNAGEHPQVAYK